MSQVLRAGVLLVAISLHFISKKASGSGNVNFYINGLGFGSYGFLDNTNEYGWKHEGDFSFGGGGTGELVFWSRFGLESGYLLSDRKFSRTITGLKANVTIKTNRVPVIGRLYLAKFLSIGAGFFFDFVPTTGCFSNGKDYGYLLDARYQMQPGSDRFRLLFGLQFASGIKECILLGNAALRALYFYAGFSIRIV